MQRCLQSEGSICMKMTGCRPGRVLACSVVTMPNGGGGVESLDREASDMGLSSRPRAHLPPHLRDIDIIRNILCSPQRCSLIVE